MTVRFHIDPRLPSVSAKDLTCTCGQTLDTLLGKGCRTLTFRHFTKPVETDEGDGLHYTVQVGRINGYISAHPDLCPTTKDDLSTLIYRAQRAAAELGPPCPLPRSGAAWQPPPRRQQPKAAKPAPLSTIDKMIAETRRTSR